MSGPALMVPLVLLLVALAGYPAGPWRIRRLSYKLTEWRADLGGDWIRLTVTIHAIELAVATCWRSAFAPLLDAFEQWNKREQS